MGISVEYINNLLKDFDESGQRKRGTQWRRTNASLNEGTRRVAMKNMPQSLDEARPQAAGSYYSYARTLITYVYYYIHQWIKSFPADALSYGPLQIDRTEMKNGRMRTDRYIDIYVNPDALWRDSLWNSSLDARVPADTLAQRMRRQRAQAYWSTAKNKYGVDNILTLFEYGWHARGRVQGKWHGVMTWNRQNMNGSYMLHNAIAAFNRTTPRGITAKLGSEYS